MSNTTKSIYDNIKTAKDLIREVMAHGLSTKIEDICRAQDIFGNSTVGELEALATDKDRTQGTFYQIIFEIWGWERATEYYNQHSNQLYIEGREAVKESDKLKSELAHKLDQITKLIDDVADYEDTIKQMRDEKVDCQKQLDEKDTEVIKLKAQLYDLMIANKQ